MKIRTKIKAGYPPSPCSLRGECLRREGGMHENQDHGENGYFAGSLLAAWKTSYPMTPWPSIFHA